MGCGCKESLGGLRGYPQAFERFRGTGYSKDSEIGRLLLSAIKQLEKDNEKDKDVFI